MKENFKSAWHSVRSIFKGGCSFAEIKDIVAEADLPVERLSGLQQRSLPATSSTKGQLVDAVDDLIFSDADPDSALRRILVALWDAKPALRESIAFKIGMFGLTVEGGNLVEKNDSSTGGKINNVPAIARIMNAKDSQYELEIFISHSSKDADLAEALIDLLRAALNIPHSKIRCTSVDGYRLPAGSSTNDQLKTEVRNSRCFIALLTPSSLQSSYVLFELGARWGAGLNCLPLLGRGLSADLLGMPLSALNALSCASSAQVHQLLGDVGRILGQSPSSPAVYEKFLQKLIATQSPVAERDEKKSVNLSPKEPASETLRPETKEFLEILERTDRDQRGVVEILQEIEPGQIMFFPCIQYSGSPLSMKARLFRSAVSQLVSTGYLLPSEDNPSRGTRTYEYGIGDRDVESSK